MIVSNYTRFGGRHTDSAVLCNVFRAAGVTDPHSRQPYSEAMIAGLGGGIGFSYFVYEQRQKPARLSLSSRFHSQKQNFVDGVIRRSGVSANIRYTSSPRRAHDELLAVLESGSAVACTVDPPLLPHRGMPASSRGSSSQLISVVGIEGENVLIDDVCQQPIPITTDQLAAARLSSRRARHRMMTITPARYPINPAKSVQASIQSTCQLFLDPPVSNFGFAGLEKWSRLLVNPDNRRGWPRLFSPPRALFSALNHTYTSLRFERAAPGAMRPMFADFLEESADILSNPQLLQVASQYRRSGELWGQLTDLALPIEDPTLWRCRQISEKRQSLLQNYGASATAEMRRLWGELEELARRFVSPWSEADRMFRFRAMARLLRNIISIEQAAITTLWRLTRE